MKITSLVLAILLTASLCPVAAEEVLSAEKLAKRADELLARADFEGAFEAYAAASKAEPENATYRGQALLLKRVISLRRYVAQNEPSAKWLKMVISLHAYYHRTGLPAEALKHDLAAHEKSDSATTASLLSETLLDLDRGEEVVTLLGGEKPKYPSAQNWLYLAIAQARRGTDAAKKAAAESLKLAAKAGIPEGSGLAFDLARIHALLGDDPKAAAAMRTCLEQTSPAGIEQVREFFKACKDLREFLATEAGAKALATESRVEPAGCSGGSDCGSCPKRSGCGEKKDGDSKKQ